MAASMISTIGVQGRWRLSLVGVGLVAFLVAATVSWVVPFAPRVHDEFSYLLAADTLLHGRLANPRPEVWQPFQSFHILVEPTYASKYPLGHGAMVALGWALFGLPIAGCWLAAGMCAASVTWMLHAITCRRWSVFGGLLIACHPAMQVTWSPMLLSGWLTAAGSALLTGGALRLRRGPQPLASAAGGVGVAVLALTRPFEGLVATLVVSGVLWQLWQGKSLRQKCFDALRTIPAAALPVGGGLLLIGLQNYAISGKFTCMPYQLHEQKYGVAPLFVFGQPQTPALAASGEVPVTVSAYHSGWSLDCFQQRSGGLGWLQGIVEAVWTMWSFWVLLAMVPILTMGYWGRFRVPRSMVVAIAVQVLLSASVCWIFPHYLSPVLPWLTVLCVLGLRRIFRLFAKLQVVRLGQSSRFVGAVLSAQLVLLCVSVVRLSGDPARAWAVRRAETAKALETQSGLHLVLVHYGPHHNVHQEWVYNGADLENAKVLWARGERDDWNERLQSQYAGRRFIWQLQPDLPDAEPQLLSAPSKGSGLFDE